MRGFAPGTTARPRVDTSQWRAMKCCLHGTFLAVCESIKVVEVVVPPVVKAGESVILECRYKEEGDTLYTLKWWRGDDQFYQLVPPKRSYYHASGVSVNMSATEHLNPHDSKGLERVMLEPVSLDAAGAYKCEVMADITFHTVSKMANMSVIFVHGVRLMFRSTAPHPKIYWIEVEGVGRPDIRRRVVNLASLVQSDLLE
ncbi:Immunoglobulin [Trinorchestia longiramus]|nr:Immunoglobulin [Trinorchestia longiramus]